MVRRGYRSPPYHNWYLCFISQTVFYTVMCRCHGFTVAHFAFLLLRQGDLPLSRYTSKLLYRLDTQLNQTRTSLPRKLQHLPHPHLCSLEQFALLIAAMCHDLDHRGTNNSYQVRLHNTRISCHQSKDSHQSNYTMG